MIHNILFLVVMVFFVGCSSWPIATSDQQVDTAINRFITADPSLSQFINSSYAYMVFPRVEKQGDAIGSVSSQGSVFVNNNRAGIVKMTQTTVGFLLGSQPYSQLVCFETEEAFNILKNNALTFDKHLIANPVRSDMAKSVDYQNGIAVFTMTTGGLMYEAKIDSQEFTY